MTIVKTDFHIDRAGPKKQSKPPGDENFLDGTIPDCSFRCYEWKQKKKKMGVREIRISGLSYLSITTHFCII